jgi:hypothetical protein
MTVTNQNYIHEEIKCRLDSGNACYNSIQNFFFPHFLHKNMKIKRCKTIIVYVELYACEASCLKLGEEHRLRLSGTGCWEEFWDLWAEVIWRWRKLHNERPSQFIFFTKHLEYRADCGIKLQSGNRVWGCGLDSSEWRYGPMGSACEHCNEPLGSINGRIFAGYWGIISLPKWTLLHGIMWDTRNFNTVAQCRSAWICYLMLHWFAYLKFPK